MPTSGPSKPDPGARDATVLTKTIARARAGERTATEQLIRSYQGRIARFVIAHTADKNDYEDLCQKVFVKMVLGLPRLKAPDTFEAWLFTIARHVCIDHLRSRRGWRAIFVRLEAKHESTAAPEPALSAIDADAVSRALKQIRPAERELLAMAMDKGKSYQEMARDSKIGLAALKSRLFRARKMLKQMICDGESYDGSRETCQRRR
jgi:RNA polymerase sigma factor (sigma-70 family)